MARISWGRTRVKLRLLRRCVCVGGGCWEKALSSDYLMEQALSHFTVLLIFSGILNALTNISAKY